MLAVKAAHASRSETENARFSIRPERQREPQIRASQNGRAAKVTADEPADQFSKLLFHDEWRSLLIKVDYRRLREMPFLSTKSGEIEPPTTIAAAAVSHRSLFLSLSSRREKSPFAHRAVLQRFSAGSWSGPRRVRGPNSGCHPAPFATPASLTSGIAPRWRGRMRGLPARQTPRIRDLDAFILADLIRGGESA